MGELDARTDHRCLLLVCLCLVGRRAEQVQEEEEKEDEKEGRPL